MSILASALILAKKGYAAHWLRHRSKAPIAEGWSTVPIASITELRQTYRPGYNAGVRCGEWSQPIPDLGLIVVDGDIKPPANTDLAREATREAHDVLATLLDGVLGSPLVASGRANGSQHIWLG